VIQIVGQEEVYGFMTILDWQRNRTRPCIQAIKRYIFSKLPSSSKPQWQSVFQDTHAKIGLIISERLPNVPEELAPHLNILTWDEMKQNKFSFDYYLLIANAYKEGEDDTDGGDLGPKKKFKRSSAANALHYYKPEDEIYHHAAALKAATRLMRNNQANRWTLAMFQQLSKLFILFKHDQLPSILNQFHQLVE
jgi:hypothetical protein